MKKVSRKFVKTRVLPIAVILAVLMLLAVIYAESLQSPAETFGFGVYWPAPAQYAAGHQLPNVYLGINNTGGGVRQYSYVIFDGSSILTKGDVPVGSLSPFRVLVYAAVPASLEARVYVQGRLVYDQNLTLQ